MEEIQIHVILVMRLDILLDHVEEIRRGAVTDSMEAQVQIVLRQIPRVLRHVPHQMHITIIMHRMSSQHE